MLSKYIHDLLYRYECVIIPDFGGILTKVVSAKIDPETHTFYPPSKRLAFNSQLTENDGLLANHIALVDKIPYETAVNYIKFEVIEWKNKLQKEDLSLENIGVFSLNSEGKIVFEPDPNSNFLTDAFGLSAVNTHLVTRKDEVEELLKINDSGIITNDEIAVNKTVIRDISPFYKYAAAFIILLAIIGAFAIQILDLNKKEGQLTKIKNNQKGQINRIIQEATFEINSKLPDITIKINQDGDAVEDNDSINALEQAIINNTNNPKVQIKRERIEKALAKKALLEKTTDDKEENSIEETKITVETSNKKAKVTNEPLNSSFKYHIIAGAFREAANAEKKVRQLKAKGYNNATIVGVNKWKLNQVAFASYKTKEEAQQALDAIKKQETKDAWLLVK